MMRLRAYITRSDFLLLVTVLVLAGLLFVVSSRWLVSPGTQVEILAGEKTVGVYPLDQDRVVEVMGRLGKTVVEIKGGRARIRSSPCPNKLCMHMGELGAAGGCVVCAPNQVVLRLRSAPVDGVDAVSR